MQSTLQHRHGNVPLMCVVGDLVESQVVSVVSGFRDFSGVRRLFRDVCLDDGSILGDVWVEAGSLEL